MIVCAHEDYEPMNKVGMIWSLIEVETFGTLTFWSYKHEAPNETKMLKKLKFEQRISRLLQDKESKVFIVATDDGEIQIIPREVIIEKKPIAENIFRQKLVSGRIVGMTWLVEGKIIVVAGTDNSMKLFDVGSLQIVGGGSLNKRLDGASLTILQVDQTSSLVFLGTTQGTILAYNINLTTFAPNFKYLIHVGGGELANVAVSALLFSHGNIFVGCGSQVFIYNVAGGNEPKSVFL